MASQKTLPTAITVESFISAIEDENVRRDTSELMNIMQSATSENAIMWGTAIIGFGNYHYKYASGREGDSCKVGFSPRKDKISLYLSCDLQQYASTLAKLGKHKTGKGCLYIKKLEDIDIAVLKELISIGYHTKKTGEL